MEFAIALTRRVRRRKLTTGAVVQQTRWVLNYRDPKTGQRRQEFYSVQKEALARKTELVVKVGTGTYVEERTAPTVAEAIDHWLADRAGKVKANTLANFTNVTKHIRGPVLIASKRERAEFALTGIKPKNARFLPMLGAVKATELTTADLRGWHRLVTEHAGAYTANRALSHLKGVLALAEEDFGVRAPAMPTGLERGRQRSRKLILATANIAKVIEAAKADAEHGIYYAFPFLAGTRPSEQLGLLWEDVDFDRNVICIRRILERDGTLTEMTKTEAGTREVPVGATLREMLLAWRVRCPRREKELHLVFPGPGRLQPWPKPRLGGGGALLYQNFRKHYWAPMFKQLGLPYVSPHSARHSYISTMQAQGIEVGLVAKLAGHANATVTLGHYTQAVRGGEAAAAALEKAYAGG